MRSDRKSLCKRESFSTLSVRHNAPSILTSSSTLLNCTYITKLLNRPLTLNAVGEIWSWKWRCWKGIIHVSAFASFRSLSIAVLHSCFASTGFHTMHQYITMTCSCPGDLCIDSCKEEIASQWNILEQWC